MVAILAGESSIREVIAFPKTAAAVDLMSGAPSAVDQKQLDELKLRLAATEASAVALILRATNDELRVRNGQMSIRAISTRSS